MIISVISPHMRNSGNTTTALLLAHALADLKRHVFFTHVLPQSSSIETYLGLNSYEDKTSTPSQLVKLMREGAIKVEDIGDYCKNDVDFLHIFTNNKENFSQDDMHTLIDYITSSPDPIYDYMVFDVDTTTDNPTAQMILKKSDIIILNLSASVYQINEFNKMESKLVKLFQGKKLFMVVNQYEQRAMKLKEVAKYLKTKASPYTIRHNSWVQWACNKGKLSYLYTQGKIKDGEVIDIFKDVNAIASGVAKAKVIIAKQRQKEGRPLPTPKQAEPPKDNKKASKDKQSEDVTTSTDKVEEKVVENTTQPTPQEQTNQ